MLDLNFANEIQSWIAVKSFAVEDANPQAPIIDANELADFITSLVSKYQDEANMSNLSPDTNELIDNFARQMKVKLHKAQEKYGYNDNWKNSDWETACKVELYCHLDKGDPIDVANYCAFMHFHKWPTNFENSAYSLMPYEPTKEMMLGAFEHWADARCYYLDKRDDGHYEKSSTALAWEIAQYFMTIGRGQGVELEGCVVVQLENVRYFSNDGENYEIHQTIEDAKREAECAIEYYSERLADQLIDPRSDGNFQQISYGVVLAESSYSIDHIVTQQDKDNGDYSYEVGTEIMSLFLAEAARGGK